MTPEQFQDECAPHIEALQALVNKMPSHGLKIEDCQQLQLLSCLTQFERAVDSVEPFDFVTVNMMDDGLFLKDSAEEAFNNDPSLNLYEVDVWFNDEDDSTTVIEEYRCLVAAMSKDQIEAMGEEIQQMLSVDNDLFINIDSVEQVHSGTTN